MRLPASRNSGIVLGLCITLTVTALALAFDDVKTSLDQLPKAARDAILREAAGAKITEVERETHNGATVYEAEWRVNGAEREVCVTADGDIVEMEEEIPAASAPAAVRAAITKHFGADARVKVEKKTVIVYELEGRINGKGREILVSATGNVHHEADGNDNGDDGDDDDD